MEAEGSSGFGVLPLLILVVIGLVVQAVHRMLHHSVSILPCLTTKVSSLGRVAGCRTWMPTQLASLALAKQMAVGPQARQPDGPSRILLADEQ